MQMNHRITATEQAAWRNVADKYKRTLLFAVSTLVIAVLAACGQPAVSPEVAEERPVTEGQDAGSFNWTGAAIGYEDDEQALELSSSAEEGVVIVGSGEDIWGNRDEFYYTYTELKGDGALSVRVEELSAADPWSKAGVMIRESLEPDARNAMIHISANNGSVYQARLERGDVTVNSAGRDDNNAVPGWLRLSRNGDVLTGELSADGENWNPIGSYEIAMEEDVYIGMAVTAHARGAKATARFTNLKAYTESPVTISPDPSDPVTPPAPERPAPTVPGAPGSTYTPPPATLYVATNGNDSNSGRSESAPLRTLNKAASIVRPGDVVYIRGGVYPLETKIRTSGTASEPIVWTSYPGEWAIFDGSGRNPGVDKDRFWIDGASHNIFANFEVRNGPRQGIYVINGANDNLLTGIVTHGHNGSGIQNVSSSRNTFQYITTYDNFDRINSKNQPGEDADGIGISSGRDNVISHVLAYDNADDGIDAWKSTYTLIEYTVVHSNGRGSHGNGNGIKAGGGIDNYTTVRHTIAYNNKAVGFTNNSGRHISFINNTSFGNGNYAFLGHTDVTFTNNLAIGGTLMVHSSNQRSNSWNLNISDARPVSTDSAHPEFLALRSDSPAINAGVPTGYEYSGSAPDLGALEYGVTIAGILGIENPQIAIASLGQQQPADYMAMGN